MTITITNIAIITINIITIITIKEDTVHFIMKMNDNYADYVKDRVLTSMRPSIKNPELIFISWFSCFICNSSGRKQCSTCRGSGKLKCYIQLTVTYKCHENDFIKKSARIPDDSLRKCQAHVTFSEQNERVREYSLVYERIKC